VKKIKVKAPAKLNLNLQVFPQIRKGYHLIQFLNCSLNLHDEIVLTEKNRGIEVICSHPQVPCSEKNFCYQVALKLKKYSPKGVKIEIIKNIPLRAGLGGGSSDAAAVLQGLNRLWQLGLEEKTLIKIGQKIGTDVCYCLIGSLSLVSGIGEKIEKLNLKMPKISLVIIVPQEQKPSTTWAYQNLDCQQIGRNEKKLVRLIEALKKKDILGIAENLHNDFEYSLEKKFPMIKKIKNDLKNQGASRAMLCGSGLAVFGMFEKKSQAQKAFNILKKKYQTIFLTSTI